MRLALNQILGPLELTYVFREQALVVTSMERAEYNLSIAVYPIADLLGPLGRPDLFGNRARSPDMAGMVDLIQSTIAPATWADTQGGPGTLEYLPSVDALVVGQTHAIHDQLVDLLTNLRRHAADKPNGSGPAAAEGNSVRLVVYRLPRKPSSSLPAPSGAAVPAAEGKKESPPPKETPADSLKQSVGGGLSWSGPNLDFPTIPEERLVELIMTLIEPESWAAKQDVKCLSAPGVLIVCHTDAVHRNIRALLAELGVAVVDPNELRRKPSFGSGAGGTSGPWPKS